MRRGVERQPSRREIIAAGAAAVLTLSSGLGVAGPVVVSGTVFNDRRGTGRRMPGDPGIAGVMVSNGRDVVLTDSEGRWRLPVAGGDDVFLIKPPHWATPVGLGGVPCIGARHNHADGPGDAAVSADRLSPTLDFALTRSPENARFEAVLMADSQPANAAELGYLCDDIISSIVGAGAAFGINHGDVVFDDLSLYPRYLKILGACGIPWHHCPGNHDIDQAAASDQASRDTWRRTFGPRHYAFQYAEATFILLDNVYYHGQHPEHSNRGGYHGLIGAEQLQFVRNVLAHVARDRLVVLSMHIPLMNYQNATAAADTTVDRHALLALLSGRPHTVSFAGHMHLTEHHYLGAEAGFYGAVPHHHHVLTAASGGWWSGAKDARGIPAADAEDGSPNGYHMLSVDGAKYDTRFVPAAGKPAARLRASIERPSPGTPRPPALSSADLQHGELVVNVFDGGPATRVRYSIAGVTSEPRPMQRVASPDPHVARVFADHRELQKPWMRALSSSHLWRAPLPTSLRPGAYCASVQADDEYGRPLRTHLLLRCWRRILARESLPAFTPSIPAGADPRRITGPDTRGPAMTVTVWVLIGYCLLALVLHVASIAVAWARSRCPAPGVGLPDHGQTVSVIRPVCGLEDLEQVTLASSFHLTWPKTELLFCVASATDPALPFLQRLIAVHASRNAHILIGDNCETANPKLNNLIKGWQAAKGEWIILADSNLLLPPDYVEQLLARFTPDAGLVCAPPIAAAPRGFWAEVECGFLNTYQGRWQYAADALGFGFAQGKSMLWRRADLDRLGGITALGSELAEDAAATKLVRAGGRKVRLAGPSFQQPIGERCAARVINRQTRWAQLRRITFPRYFLPEILTGSLPPALAGAFASEMLDGPGVSIALGFVTVWLGLEASLARAAGWPLSWRSPLAWLVRDALIPLIWVRAYTAGGYEWRGNKVAIAGAGTAALSPGPA